MCRPGIESGECKEILELLLNGFRDEAWKEELRRIEERRRELNALNPASEAEPPMPALHPAMAQVFRDKATHLAAALNDDAQKEHARSILRRFVEQIVIPPGDRILRGVGNPGEMLTAASGRNAAVLAAVGYVGCGGGI